MFIPLPELDDRRYGDLVDEGRSLIPTYAPTWTDHNAHDPGITVMELLAWVTEASIYSVDRIPERHRRAFLAMLGIEPEPPQAATAVVQFALKAGQGPARLPSGAELTALLLDGTRGTFQLVGELPVLPVTLSAIQVQSGSRFADVTGGAARGRPFALLGADPRLGDALYLGFDAPLAAGATLRLEIGLDGDRSGWSERQRIEREAIEALLARSPRLGSGLSRAGRAGHPLAQRLPAEALAHHSATLVWEAQVAAGTWESLEADDDTRSASLSGSVRLRFSRATVAVRTGATEAALHYVRCRLASGTLDVAPMASFVRGNAARVRQVSRAWEAWTIARGVVACGTRPPAGELAWLSLELERGEIRALEFGEPGPDTLRVRVLSFEPATDLRPGRLVIEAARIGVGDGAPHQQLALPGPHVDPDSVEIYTLEEGAIVRWQRQASLRSQGPAARVFLLDAAAASVSFGDGQNGRVPPPGATLIAIADRTAGEAGNVAAGAIDGLATFFPDTDRLLSARNAALFPDLRQFALRFEIGNLGPASGGTPAEALIHAEGRALEAVQHTHRAVTLADCERLALETPGTAVARAAARANCLPGLDCYTALGFITLVVVPFLPAARPTPSAALIGAVSRYLDRRRVLGTRIVVTGPEYLEVAVNAEVQAFKGQDKPAVRAAVEQALRDFLDPLGGGPERTGWSLGRDVYVSEILDIISRVPGVDHVSSVELAVPGCEGQCGDVCLRPLALVVSGAHRIVVR